MKHTQDEWEISHNNNQGIRIVTNPDTPLKTSIICSLAGNPREDEVYANAKLIAAAPDLLEALIKLYNAIDSCVDLTPEILKECINAIKKATK